MAELIQFPLESGGSITVEVSPEAGRAVRGLRGSSAETIGKAGQTLEEALDNIGPTAAAVVQKLREGIEAPSDIEVAFGITLKTEAGAIVAKVGGEANFQVTARWSRADEGK
jgi:hypothetical protein